VKKNYSSKYVKRISLKFPAFEWPKHLAVVRFAADNITTYGIPRENLR